MTSLQAIQKPSQTSLSPTFKTIISNEKIKPSRGLTCTSVDVRDNTTELFSAEQRAAMVELAQSTNQEGFMSG